MRFLSTLLLLGALFAGFPAPGGAQTVDVTAETSALMLERWNSEARLIELRLAEHPPEAAEIDEMLEIISLQRDAVLDLVAIALAGLKPLVRQLEALGDPPEDPAAERQEIANERKRLIELIAALDGSCFFPRSI